MTQTVEKALDLWGMNGAKWRLIAARENRVFRADHGGKSFAFRLHRAGYRTNAELVSELEWMGAVADGGLHVPAPIRSTSGDYLHVVDDVQIDVLTWLSGAPIGKTGEPLQTADRDDLFFRLGREMARLHKLSDDWTPPNNFTRCHWDRKGLVGDSPLWGRFWENPTLTSEDRELFMRIRDHANAQLEEAEASLDFGLIHADLVRENVMADGDKLQFIDFDDAGFGFRIFDLATTLIKNMREPDYPQLRDALIKGYRSHRPIDTDMLDLFILLRALTYVGWITTRMDEDGSAIRNQRFVTTARELANETLISN
ncbi:Stress response kinase A [Aliiroseovarius pelagivivens]|uniref:Stress response kinase A n=1 Tax=Aliiroseovarius pelagivivens TaxID=1639690 RepID=A0A2R8ASN6_9RHOB|nr:homoserine kinase [Aliiroseovarius pelagivivens]SPF78879.1 Stress response kinase A [Aliiroseovarius pelagivivens]